MRNIQEINQVIIDLQWDKLDFSQMRVIFKMVFLSQHLTQKYFGHNHQAKILMFIYILTDKLFLKIC